jgi:hypothetical protein
MTYTKNQIEFLSTLRKMFPGQTQFTRKELLLAKTALGYSVIPVWITGDSQRKSGRAIYSFPELANDPASLPVSNDTRGAPRKNLTAATPAAQTATA